MSRTFIYHLSKKVRYTTHMIRQETPFQLELALNDHLVFWLMLGAVLLISRTPLRHPFKWQETFFHELSHGLAAILTFGWISRIVLKLNGAGVCYTRGGFSIVILLAGYLGAAFFGGLLYLAGWMYGEQQSATLMLFLLIFYGLITLFFVRDITTIFIMASMGGAIWLALQLPQFDLLPLWLQFSGMYVMVSAIQSPLHLIDGEHHGDGAMLADRLFLPEIFWIALWFCASCFVLFLAWSLNAPELAGAITQKAAGLADSFLPFR
jgi:hypothetical protein